MQTGDKVFTIETMKIIKQFILLIGLLFLVACAEEPNANDANSNQTQEKISTSKSEVSDDFVILGERVKLPFEPDDVKWQEETFENGKKITAVIKFYREDIDKLLTMLEKVEVNEAVGIEPEEWFPDEIKAQAEQTGDATMRGTYYKTTTFQQEPFTKGTLVRITNTDYFILYLSTN